MLDEIVAQARDEAPDECCGMIAIADGEAVAVHPAENTAAQPAALRDRRDGAVPDPDGDRGRRATTSARSTTRTRARPPMPSQTDINLAFYPDALYLIVGVAGDGGRRARVAHRRRPGRRGRARGRRRARGGRPRSCARGAAPAVRADERFCPRCGSPLVHRGRRAAAQEADPSARERARKVHPPYAEGALVRVRARAQPGRGGAAPGAPARRGRAVARAPLGRLRRARLPRRRPARRARAARAARTAAREVLGAARAATVSVARATPWVRALALVLAIFVVALVAASVLDAIL